jgi:hypothetical protein
VSLRGGTTKQSVIQPTIPTVKKQAIARLRTCWLVKCFALSRTILLDSVEFGKVKLKSDFKNLHNYLKINILAKKAKNTEGVTFKI